MDRMRLAAMRLANCKLQLDRDDLHQVCIYKRQSRISIIRKSLCLPLVRCSAGFMHVRSKTAARHRSWFGDAISGIAVENGVHGRHEPAKHSSASTPPQRLYYLSETYS